MSDKPRRTSLGCNHTIHSGHNHMTWDNARLPAITVAPGDSVAFENVDVASGQLNEKSTLKDLSEIDLDLVSPIAGPVYVDGAEPGDSLKVTMLDFEPFGWGWTAILPGFGLLADDFPHLALNIWSFDKTFTRPAFFSSGAKIPLKPFCGTIGNAPAAPGPHSTIPPYSSGGNMDIRDLTVGVELYLPVEVKGALFSIGDTHAAQGDGEVCGTAIEAPMNVAVKFDLVKNENLSFPRFRTPGPVTRHLDDKGYDVTTGIGPDLMEATQNAVRGMIDLLGKQQGLNPEDAYMLCSVCADLRISEIVDQPNWVVSCYIPRVVFE